MAPANFLPLTSRKICQRTMGMDRISCYPHHLGFRLPNRHDTREQAQRRHVMEGKFTCELLSSAHQGRARCSTEWQDCSRGRGDCRESEGQVEEHRSRIPFGSSSRSMILGDNPTTRVTTLSAVQSLFFLLRLYNSSH
jgi:hypothetical protein